MGPLSWAPPGPCRFPFSWHSPPPSQGVDRAGRRVRQHGDQQGAGRTRGGQERGPGSGPGCSGQAAGEGRVSPAPVTWAAPRPAQFRERWHLRAPGQEEGGEGTPSPRKPRGRCQCRGQPLQLQGQGRRAAGESSPHLATARRRRGGAVAVLPAAPGRPRARAHAPSRQIPVLGPQGGRTRFRLGFTEGEAEAWQGALAEAADGARERQRGGGRSARGFLAQVARPSPPSLPLGVKGPRPGKPTAQVPPRREGAKALPPRTPPQGESCGAQSGGSLRVTIRAHTGRGARGDAALGLGTSSRCAGAPGRFKPGSQARPPAPTTPPRGGWTGPAPVDSHSSLSPRDLGTRGRSPSSLSRSV